VTESGSQYGDSQNGIDKLRSLSQEKRQDMFAKFENLYEKVGDLLHSAEFTSGFGEVSHASLIELETAFDEIAREKTMRSGWLAGVLEELAQLRTLKVSSDRSGVDADARLARLEVLKVEVERFLASEQLYYEDPVNAVMQLRQALSQVDL
jgi:hypothetical protein